MALMHRLFDRIGDWWAGTTDSGREGNVSWYGINYPWPRRGWEWLCRRNWQTIAAAVAIAIGLLTFLFRN